MLPASGRVAYQDIDRVMYDYVDFNTAQNKVALIHEKEHRVSYGIDALNVILSKPFPWVGILLQFKPIYWFMTKLYLLLSLNRKIIVPVSCSKLGSCSPSRSWFWRVIFIVLCGLVVNLIVGNYFVTHLSKYYIANPIYGDALFFTGQLLFQALCCKLLKEPNVYDYLGQVSIVSFLGALLLGCFSIGLSIFSFFGMNTELLSGVCFGVVYAFMFYEHRRRLRIAEMNSYLTLTWILYRFIIYAFAFRL